MNPPEMPSITEQQAAHRFLELMALGLKAHWPFLSHNIFALGPADLKKAVAGSSAA